jgi:hypothetical protein
MKLVLVRRHSAMLVGLVAQALQYGSALMLLPFLVTRLSAAEVGIWYVFVTVQGLALLADFGFQPTIARAFAAAFGGARELRTTGLATEASREPNYHLARQVLKAARWLYLGLALVTAAILLTVGTRYIVSIATGQVPDLQDVILAWTVFSAGTALNLYLVWVSPLMLGSGRVTQNYLFLIAGRGSFALIGIGVLMAGGGLLGLAIANLVSNVLARLVAIPLMRPVAASLKGTVPASEVRDTLARLWPNAGRMGLVAVSGFLITRANVLILSTFVGLETAASYAISLQLLTALAMVAMLPTQIALPRIVELRIRDDMAGLRHLLLGRMAFFFGAYMAGAVAIVIGGQFGFALVGSEVELLPQALLSLLALVVMLEMNHSNAAFVITTANDVPFVAPALLSAAAILLLSMGLVWAGMGAFGAILAQGLVQGAYNNWKWPLTAWRGVQDRRVKI